MTVEQRLISLLLAWHEQHLGGVDVPATVLCRDCPELTEQLAQRIEILRKMNALLGTGSAFHSAETPPAAGGPAPP